MQTFICAASAAEILGVEPNELEAVDGGDGEEINIDQLRPLVGKLQAAGMNPSPDWDAIKGIDSFATDRIEMFGTPQITIPAGWDPTDSIQASEAAAGEAPTDGEEYIDAAELADILDTDEMSARRITVAAGYDPDFITAADLTAIAIAKSRQEALRQRQWQADPIQAMADLLGITSPR